MLIGLLYYGYSGLQGSAKEVKQGLTTRDVIACQLNREAVQHAMAIWKASHPGRQPTLQELKRDGVQILPCPSGGKLKIEGNRVICSIHSPHSHTSN